MEVAVSNCAWGGGGVNYQLYGEDDDENAEGELEVEIEEGKQFKHVRGHFQCDQTIPVDSPVLRICALPFENNIIAVKTATGVVTVYNTLQQDEEGGESSPEAITDAVLDGSRVGGFGLAWSPVKIGFLASAGDDGLLQYWDVRHQLSVDLKEHTDRAEDAHGPLVAAAHTFTGHRDSITSCDWHHSQGHLLATSGLDGDLRLWDIRTSKCAGTVPSAHEGGALCCQFHPSSAHQLTSSGADGSLHLYDIRKTMAPPLLTLDYHGKAVYRFSWSPFAESVLCSAGDDGRVVLWDISKSTVSASYTSRVAPPEVSFLHLGHLGKVTDVAWCTSVEEPWLLASTDSSNGLQLYRPREEVVKDHLSVFEW
ncbi:histone-binding protein RBBP4 [Angomonas deanei]|uniref:WD domain, G-beta repeat, putative n=1 Tax=Angomonas deanei TaxID=59799 RepID=S9V6Z7_9TRYP|nr:histone-binding protein RBBP4 [Angomonas deanei]EPY36583.1 histone-binding protein RBBP4 [Angomonas deanei]CAD2218210.1 WD domain, G-beta repeat, putative [Angomonas deanei]|eukprot:EPY32221.1 histone-binding protein RBBP4 [Angomonas deanei]